MKPTALLLFAGLAGYCQTVPDARTGITYFTDNGVSAPVLIDKKALEYSDSAFKAMYHGTVTLWLVVSPHGIPEDIKVVHAVGLGLDEKAAEAVSQWRFDPGMKAGHPVRVAAIVEANFRLRGWRIARLEYSAPPNTSPPTTTLRFVPFLGESCGAVTLMLQIGANGLPDNIRAARSTRESMSEAAIEAVKTWRFKPARRNGIPVTAGAELDLTCEPWPTPT